MACRPSLGLDSSCRVAVVKSARMHLKAWQALALATLLLATQALFLVHGVAHGPALVSVAAGGHAAAHDTQPHDDSHGADHHTPASAECRLLDQVLGHADGGLPAATVWVDRAGAPCWVASPVAGCVTRCVRAYQARGPPVA